MIFACCTDGCTQGGAVHISVGENMDGIMSGYSGASYCSFEHLAEDLPALRETFGRIIAEIAEGNSE